MRRGVARQGKVYYKQMNKKLQTLYDLRNTLELTRLEFLAEGERAQGVDTPSRQHRCWCIAQGLKIAIDKVNELIANQEDQETGE